MMIGRFQVSVFEKPQQLYVISHFQKNNVT